MALMPQIILSWVDDKGKTTTTKWHILDGYSVANMKSYAEAAAQLFKDVSDAKITDITVSVGLDLSLASLKTVATTTADWFTKLFVQARDFSTGLIAKYFIPTFDESNITAGSDVANSADADVIALRTILEDGVDDGGIPIFAVTGYDTNVDNVDFMSENFHKS
jgi:hypothetical protein